MSGRDGPVPPTPPQSEPDRTAWPPPSEEDRVELTRTWVGVVPWVLAFVALVVVGILVLL